MATSAVATPNTIIDVLVRIDNEMQDYPKCSTEFNRRVFAMNSILAKLDDDTLMYVVYKVKERIGHDVCRARDLAGRGVTLDREIVKKLMKQGCTVGKAHAVYSYKK